MSNWLALSIFIGALNLFLIVAACAATFFDWLAARRRPTLSEREARAGLHPRTGRVSPSPVDPPVADGRDPKTYVAVRHTHRRVA